MNGIRGFESAAVYRQSSKAEQTAPLQKGDTKNAESTKNKREDQAVLTLSPQKEENDHKSLYEMMQEAREKAEARRKSLQLPKNSARYGDAPIIAYSKLSRARNQAEISAAAGYARRQIAYLKAAKRQDSDNADRIQAAINQLQKAVTRAGKKRRELDQEKISQARQKKLERENQSREARRSRLELHRRKTMRVIRENGYIREAVVDNRIQDHLSSSRMELQRQAQSLSRSYTASPESAAKQYAAVQAAASPDVVSAAPSSEINIQI